MMHTSDNEDGDENDDDENDGDEDPPVRRPESPHWRVIRGTFIGKNPNGSDESSKSMTEPRQILNVNRSSGTVNPDSNDVEMETMSNNRWLKVEYPLGDFRRWMAEAAETPCFVQWVGPR
mmetsp:Transcript_1561/g.3363  ORF Transcript_1561/g.3363 Transcript_1561/m.3363 type:complete len:120 (-) Transcript_1561:334-693(-)